MAEYKILDDVATADVAIEVEDANLEKLFETCARACFDVMVDRSKVKNKVKRKIELEADDEEKLLYDFIEELIFLKDSESMVFGSFDVKIKGVKLAAVCRGEAIDNERHGVKVDVKALTFHMFFLRQIGSKWKARLVLDI